MLVKARRARCLLGAADDVDDAAHRRRVIVVLEVADKPRAVLTTGRVDEREAWSALGRQRGDVARAEHEAGERNRREHRTRYRTLGVVVPRWELRRESARVRRSEHRCGERLRRVEVHELDVRVAWERYD